MLTLFADYHTHTTYSHGKGDIMDNVVAARRKGLTEIAITDHGVRHFAFGVDPGNIIKMRREIDKINEGSEGIRVLMGMECNIISAEGDVDIDDATRKHLDILLVGYHMMVLPKSLGDAFDIYGKNCLSRYHLLSGERVLEANTQAMIKAIRKYKIDIITHPGTRIAVDINAVAREAAKAGTALEINSHSSFINAEHVRAAAREGVKFAIGSDAHHPDNVGNFENGLKIALEAGLESSQVINAVQ